MKILITGGAGFIGSHIAETYLENGHQVLIVDNFSSGNRSNVPKEAEVVEADVTEDKIADVIESYKPEIVNHQAAQIEVRTSVENPALDAQINIIGSLKLLEAIRKVGTVKKVLFASSGGAAYGEAEIIPTTEDEIVKPISPYGVAKVSVEHYLFYYNQVFGLPYTALRYANVYGPRQNPHGEAGVVSIFYQRILSGKEFIINGEGNQTRDFVFVKDVARANLMATQQDIVGAINIGTANETSINELVTKMAESIDYAETINHGPAKAGEQMRSCLSFDKAEETLGWQPQVGLDQGLQQTAAFFKAQ